MKPRKNEEAQAHIGLSSHRKKIAQGYFNYSIKKDIGILRRTLLLNFFVSCPSVNRIIFILFSPLLLNTHMLLPPEDTQCHLWDWEELLPLSVSHELPPVLYILSLTLAFADFFYENFSVWVLRVFFSRGADMYMRVFKWSLTRHPRQSAGNIVVSRLIRVT
jgi:hypothetical protein